MLSGYFGVRLLGYADLLPTKIFSVGREKKGQKRKDKKTKIPFAQWRITYFVHLERGKFNLHRLILIIRPVVHVQSILKALPNTATANLKRSIRNFTPK